MHGGFLWLLFDTFTRFDKIQQVHDQYEVLSTLRGFDSGEVTVGTVEPRPGPLFRKTNNQQAKTDRRGSLFTTSGMVELMSDSHVEDPVLHTGTARLLNLKPHGPSPQRTSTHPCREGRGRGTSPLSSFPLASAVRTCLRYDGKAPYAVCVMRTKLRKSLYGYCTVALQYESTTTVLTITQELLGTSIIYGSTRAG